MKFFAVFTIAACAVLAVNADLSSDNLSKFTEEMRTAINLMQNAVDSFPHAVSTSFDKLKSKSESYIKDKTTVSTAELQKTVEFAKGDKHVDCVRLAEKEIFQWSSRVLKHLYDCEDTEIIYNLSRDFLNDARDAVEIGKRYLKGLKKSAKVELIQGSVASQFRYLIGKLNDRLKKIQNSTVYADIEDQMDTCFGYYIRDFDYKVSVAEERAKTCKGF